MLRKHVLFALFLGFSISSCDKESAFVGQWQADCTATKQNPTPTDNNQTTCQLVIEKGSMTIKWDGPLAGSCKTSNTKVVDSQRLQSSSMKCTLGGEGKIDEGCAVESRSAAFRMEEQKGIFEVSFAAPGDTTKCPAYNGAGGASIASNQLHR